MLPFESGERLARKTIILVASTKQHVVDWVYSLVSFPDPNLVDLGTRLDILHAEQDLKNRFLKRERERVTRWLLSASVAKSTRPTNNIWWLCPESEILLLLSNCPQVHWEVALPQPVVLVIRNTVPINHRLCSLFTMLRSLPAELATTNKKEKITPVQSTPIHRSSEQRRPTWGNCAFG